MCKSYCDPNEGFSPISDIWNYMKGASDGIPATLWRSASGLGGCAYRLAHGS